MSDVVHVLQCTIKYTDNAAKKEMHERNLCPQIAMSAIKSSRMFFTFH